MIFLKNAEKHSTKIVIKTEVKLFSKIVHKDRNGACSNENNMDSEVEVTFFSKDKGTKRVIDEMLL